GQWLIVGRLTGQGDLWVLHVDALDLTGVQWGREVVDDSVEQRLDTLVLVGGATEHGVDLGVDNHLADGALDLSDGEFLATEVLLHELFIRLSNGLDKLLAVLLRTLEQIRWDLLDGCVGTDRGDSTPGESLHLKKVDDAIEGILGTDRQLHDQWLGTEAVLDGAHGEVEVSTQLVHLVDKADTWDVVLGGLTP